MVTAVDSVMDKVKSIEWEALEYNFVLEKTVLEAQVIMEDTDGDTEQ